MSDQEKRYETPSVRDVPSSLGIARVYFCDPSLKQDWPFKKGCGFFAFFKPEQHSAVQCPNCHESKFFLDTGDLAHITVIKP